MDENFKLAKVINLKPKEYQTQCPWCNKDLTLSSKSFAIACDKGNDHWHMFDRSISIKIKTK